MRALVLSYPLPDPKFDNYTFVSAPSFFDYDALIVDPTGITRVVEDALRQSEELNTFVNQPVANAPTTPSTVGLAEQLLRRSDETARLLAQGGLVVCILRPNVLHNGVNGFPGCDRYYWLPAAEGVHYGGSYLMPGEGQQTVITDPSHPFARYFEEQRQIIRYHAYWADDRIPHFASFGRVFARSVGGAALGVDFSVGEGHVIFLPSADGIYAGDSRYGLAETFAKCLEEYLGGGRDEQEPAWVRSHDLPGLAPLLESEARATDRLLEAETALAAARSERTEVSKYQRLLWQEGKFGLESIVRDALSVLGFDVMQNLDEPAVIRADGESAFLEVYGSEMAVDMAPHYRLRQRREEELRRDGHYPKGLVIVNGFRLTAPADRGPQYVDALRVAAESTRYCLMTTAQLFDLVKGTLSRELNESSLQDVRSAILSTEGEFPLPVAQTPLDSMTRGVSVDDQQQS